VYGYDKQKVMLDVRPAEVPVMPAKAIDGNGWLGGDREDAGDPFVKVGFLIDLPAAGDARKFTGIRPSDFDRKWFNPPRTDETPVGSNDKLPLPVE